MKRILVPTNFTDNLSPVLRSLQDHLQGSDEPCSVLLLNTYIVQQTDPDKVILLNDELKKRSKDGLEKELSEWVKRLPDPRICFETLSHMGSLKNVISKLIKKEKLDLVVLREGNQEIETMLKQLKCPYLITSINEYQQICE